MRVSENRIVGSIFPIDKPKKSRKSHQTKVNIKDKSAYNKPCQCLFDVQKRFDYMLWSTDQETTIYSVVN